MQVIERRLAGRQRFRIAHEFEARIDGVANDIGEVVEIQGGDVLGAILQPQRAEGPVERVAFALLTGDVVIERCEAGTFGQVVPRSDAMREARVATLQKSDGRRDGCAVDLEVIRKEARRGRCASLAGQRS